MSNYIVDLFLLIAGGMFLYVGIRIKDNHKRISAAGIRTEALIIKLIEEIGHDIGDNNIGTPRYYYPIVQFIDEDGIETTQRLYSSVQPNQLNLQEPRVAIGRRLDGERDDAVGDRELRRDRDLVRSVLADPHGRRRVRRQVAREILQETPERHRI